MRNYRIMMFVFFFSLLVAIPAYSGQDQDQGKEDHPAEEEPQLDTATENPSEKEILKGRKVILESGREVFLVDIPESLMKHTKVQFDKEGKANVSCH